MQNNESIKLTGSTEGEQPGHIEDGQAPAIELSEPRSIVLCDDSLPNFTHGISKTSLLENITGRSANVGFTH